MRGTRQTEITPLRVEAPAWAKSKASVYCVPLHSNWVILSVSPFSLECTTQTASLDKSESTVLLALVVNYSVLLTMFMCSFYTYTQFDIHTHTSTCKLSWTLSFSLRSRVLFSSSTSLWTEALHSWTRSSATSLSRSERSVHVDTDRQTCRHIIKLWLELITARRDKKTKNSDEVLQETDEKNEKPSQHFVSEINIF